MVSKLINNLKNRSILKIGNRVKVCCGGIPSEKNAGKKCCNVRGEVEWYDQWEEVCLSNGIRRKKSRTEEQCGTRDTFDPAEQPKAECCRGRKFDTVCKLFRVSKQPAIIL